MPDEAYRTKFELRAVPDTLVIHCSDPKYQAHFQEFLRDHLGLESYELIAVPGGPQFLTLADYLPKFSWVGWRWVKFLVDVASPTRVVLITHEGCRWYADPRFAHLSTDTRGQEDLAQVSREIRSRFPALRVDAFVARLDEGHVVFEKV